MKGEVVVALCDQYFYQFSFQLWAEMKIPFQWLIFISAGWRARIAARASTTGVLPAQITCICIVNWRNRPARTTINSSVFSFQLIDSISARS
jgi:hypothetical protein